jgi:hypothetical protein
MKLRIKGNSIRLRLGEREVARFASQGWVSESTQFAATPGSNLTYVVAISSEEERITAGFRDNTLTVKVPERLGRHWAESAVVSLKCEQKVGNEATLSILIEKDFHCLEPRAGEDESDAYPNPSHKPSCEHE